MNGALNNASMAFEVALGDAAAADAGTERTLRAGVAAIAQASRAAALLAYLVHGRAGPTDPDGSYAGDVREILREHARSTGSTQRPELADPPGNLTANVAQAADVLLAELGRMRARLE